MLNGRSHQFNEIHGAVAKLHDVLKSASIDIDAKRRIPPPIISKLREAGVFGMCFPESWGGGGLTSWEQLQIIEELARADVATAWCAMIGCDSGLYSGFLDEETARHLFPRVDLIMAGWIHPQGRAELVDGGFRVTGKWRFASGSAHSDLIAAGCFVYHHGRLVEDENGKPIWRVILARPSDFQFNDTWFTTGLRGSRSQDYSTDDLFVPTEHSFSFSKPSRSGPLHDSPDAILRKMSGVPLGLARASLDYVYAIAEGRVDKVNETAWPKSAHIQMAIARAETSLFASRAAVQVALETLWHALETNAAARDIAYWRIQSALSRRLAFQSSREIITSLYDLQGGASIYSFESPLDRALRDVNTICQHAVAQEKILQIGGDLLLGGSAENYFI